MQHDTLLDTLADFQPFTAIVVGDMMLDEFVYGNADRLSAESPVPILDVKRAEARAGGAANLCLALAALRANVHAIGLAGQDAEADAMRDILARANTHTNGIITDNSRPTTVKRRFVGLAQHRHPQMMFRADREARHPADKQSEQRIIQAFENALPSANIVCIEDYAKGVCTPAVCAHVINACNKRKIPVLVDPATADASRYRGATAMTPNRTEAVMALASLNIKPADTTHSRTTTATTPDHDAAGPLDHAPIAQALINHLELQAILITLDRHGSLLLQKSTNSTKHNPIHVPTIARQVYDVTGAGDVVLAALAAGLANNLSWLDAARLANAAAGLKVERFGATPIPLEDIHADLLRRTKAPAEKVKTTEQLASELRALRGPAMPPQQTATTDHSNAKSNSNPPNRPTVVFTNGCFDILHAGHLSILKRAADLGDYLIVAINSDDSVKRLGKGPDRPINNEHDRAALLSGLECVDAVVIFDEDTPEKVIRQLTPDILVKGAEYSIDQIPGAQFVIDNGGRVERLEMIDGKSTTNTLHRIRSGT